MPILNKPHGVKLVSAKAFLFWEHTTPDSTLWDQREQSRLHPPVSIIKDHQQYLRGKIAQQDLVYQRRGMTLRWTTMAVVQLSPAKPFGLLLHLAHQIRIAKAFLFASPWTSPSFGWLKSERFPVMVLLCLRGAHAQDYCLAWLQPLCCCSPDAGTQFSRHSIGSYPNLITALGHIVWHAVLC
jgi:hypothetical protein